jgi:ElaB/YqjD/DUF883 family membrane-anchored ribosome-binding protein
MQSEAALILLACAVAVSSIALLIHAIASFRMYQAVKQLQADVMPLIPQAKAVLEQTQATLAQALSEVHEVSGRAKAVLERVQSQLDGLDKARVEISTQLKVQGERLELVLEDILGRTQEVVSVVHGTVLRPVREVSGMVAGVKAALQALITGRRPTVDRATQDDEMFI